MPSFVAGPGVPGVYPEPCGVCGAPARYRCRAERRIVRGVVMLVECNGKDTHGAKQAAGAASS